MESGYIYLDNNVFNSLIAISDDDQTKGLMHEPFPPPIMSFYYPSERINKFWMQNTISPLDIVFCNKGKVSEICYGEPLSTKIIGSNKYSNLIIEFPHGYVKSNNIMIGQEVGLVKPNEQELIRLIQKKYQF
jgi:uncharacterized membrane protein (UPF0127 family)